MKVLGSVLLTQKDPLILKLFSTQSKIKFFPIKLKTFDKKIKSKQYLKNDENPGENRKNFLRRISRSFNQTLVILVQINSKALAMGLTMIPNF